MNTTTNKNIPLKPLVAVTDGDWVPKADLDRLTAEMNQFCYIVSHDLQAPLRMVTGFLDLLVKRYGDRFEGQATEFIEHAVQGAEKMKTLIADLLAYSRVSTDTESVTETDLYELAQDAMESCRGTMMKVEASVIVHPMPKIQGRRNQLLWLFTQLVENAIKFKSESALRIEIHAITREGYCHISVSDNGIGIDPVFSEKIFQVFRKLNADEKKYPGNGIGLAMCRKICELHSGSIGLKSCPGKGSEFIVSLPIST